MFNNSFLKYVDIFNHSFKTQSPHRPKSQECQNNSINKIGAFGVYADSMFELEHLLNNFTSITI